MNKIKIAMICLTMAATAQASNSYPCIQLYTHGRPKQPNQLDPCCQTGTTTFEPANVQTKPLSPFSSVLSGATRPVLSAPSAHHPIYQNAQGIGSSNFLWQTPGWVKINSQGWYEGDCYNGQVNNQGLPHGYGTKYYGIGLIYEGNWVNGKREGPGTVKYLDGNPYCIGTWINDKMEGQGKILYSDGRRYVGAFHNNHRHGKGECTWPLWEKYVKKWVNEGIGVEGPNPPFKKYVGNWVNDDINGKGIMIYEDGSSYEGDWVNYKREGQGVLKDVAGHVLYVGSWTNDSQTAGGSFNPDGSSLNSSRISDADPNELSMSSQDSLGDY